MNVTPGDLAYVVVPPGYVKTFDGKFVDVLPDGFPDDFYPSLSPEDLAQSVAVSRRDHVIWYCRIHNPPTFFGDLIVHAYLLDSWLRPIRAPGEDVADETLLHLPAPREEIAA